MDAASPRCTTGTLAPDSFTIHTTVEPSSVAWTASTSQSGVASDVISPSRVLRPSHENSLSAFVLTRKPDESASQSPGT